jgi:hypothetical protein
MPGRGEELTRVVYELLDAHDDTARLATCQHLDEHWQAHLSYLRDLQRVARGLLARVGQQEGLQSFANVDASTREPGILGLSGVLTRIPRGVIDHVGSPKTGKAALDEAARNRGLRISSGNKAVPF